MGSSPFHGNNPTDLLEERYFTAKQYTAHEGCWKGGRILPVMNFGMVVTKGNRTLEGRTHEQALLPQ